MIKLSWNKRRARPLEPKLKVNPRLAELETAKQIFEEIFHARPSDVEEMIQMRLDEKNWRNSSEAFYAFDDPLEAAVFSVLMEMMKEHVRRREQDDKTDSNSK